MAELSKDGLIRLVEISLEKRFQELGENIQPLIESTVANLVEPMVIELVNKRLSEIMAERDTMESEAGREHTASGSVMGSSAVAVDDGEDNDM